MALGGLECFDIYAFADLLEYWDNAGANGSLVDGEGRSGSAAFRNTAAIGDGPYRFFTTTEDNGYWGHAYKPEALDDAHIVIEVGHNDTIGILCFLHVNSAGAINVYKGPNPTLGTFLGRTKTNLVHEGHYVHIGFAWKLHASAGYLRVYVDGNPTPAFDSGLINTTNIWTSGQWNLLHPRSKGFMDDMYWGDGAGASATGYLGDCHVEGQTALTDAIGGGGTYREFTPSTGTDHGALIGEIPPDDGATYVESPTFGTRETVKFDSIAADVVVVALQLMINLLKTQANFRSITSLQRIGGTDYSGAEQILVSDLAYHYKADPFSLNPITAAAYTPTEVNAMDGGLTIAG